MNNSFPEHTGGSYQEWKITKSSPEPRVPPRLPSFAPFVTPQEHYLVNNCYLCMGMGHAGDHVRHAAQSNMAPQQPQAPQQPPPYHHPPQPGVHPYSISHYQATHPATANSAANYYYVQHTPPPQQQYPQPSQAPYQQPPAPEPIQKEQAPPPPPPSRPATRRLRPNQQ